VHADGVERALESELDELAEPVLQDLYQPLGGLVRVVLVQLALGLERNPHDDWAPAWFDVVWAW
jgi:hypothetical protein